ncbi:MAG: CTP synthase (glutamine hydrolyzing) [Candidatus ainarchaeum sp.]|nr:CTP synthase (glutamine hydrolyzing) [Candidatus ainarchaeum sp.]
MTKFIVVTGGVISGLGKGILIASIGKLLSSKYKCAAVKCDGYLNVDPGTMNPVEHGEVFVLDDGTECDMDFGHYERFMSVSAKGDWNLTMGKIYKSILEKERKGDYLGKTVQLIPHVTDEIKSRFYKIADQEKCDVLLIEIGGTVGDMENMLYLEAVRQLAGEKGRDNVMFVHLSYVPIPKGVNEQKSKPTQLSVKTLNEIGIWPDVIAARCEDYLTEKIKKKIALFCNVDENCVFTAIDVPSVYLIPGELDKQGVREIISKKLGLELPLDGIPNWNKLAKKMVEVKNCKVNNKINIGICGKYTSLGDSYASVVEALHHCSANLDVEVCIKMIDTESIEKNPNTIQNEISNLNGIIVPGGFGNRGWEGKIEVIKYARENKVPFLGICLGLQSAVVEYARNKCNLIDANSTEMNPSTKNNVIILMDAQKKIVDKGGTMRLGSYEAKLKEGSIVSELYSSNFSFERHRHRFEVNPNIHEILIKNGLVLSGLSENGLLVEYIELPKIIHPYFVATQSHPELKSKLEKPAPLFFGLVKSAKELKELKKFI